MLVHGLEYLELGWSIIPTEPRSKRPHSRLIKRLHSATWKRFQEVKAGEEELRAWLRKSPRLVWRLF